MTPDLVGTASAGRQSIRIVHGKDHRTRGEMSRDSKFAQGDQIGSKECMTERFAYLAPMIPPTKARGTHTHGMWLGSGHRVGGDDGKKIQR